MSLRSRLKHWMTTDHSYKGPDKDEPTMVSESLMLELDLTVKELDQFYKDREQEDKRQTSGGVDYSWLVSTVFKPYEIPQLERLELEELCYKVKPAECGKIITLFRDRLLREPPVKELSRIMRSAVIQVLEERPKEETVYDWVTKRTASLSNIRMTMRPNAKVTPIEDENDIEKQYSSPLTNLRPAFQNNFLTVFHGHENEETVDI